MRSKDKLARAREKFFSQIDKDKRLPHDLSVPQDIVWIGPEPKPCDDYQVEYEGGVQGEAELRLREGGTLKALRDLLDIVLDEKVLKVRQKRGK